MRDLILIGGGEHARVVAEAVALAGVYRLIGFVDPNPYAAVETLGIPRLGNDDVLHDYPEACVHLGFGAAGPALRRVAVAERLAASGVQFASIVHPEAIISPTARVGTGSFISAGAIVQTGAVIGTHVIVNSGAIVEHDVQLGDHVQLAPRAAIGGATHIGARTFVGLGAAVRDHLRIGADTTIGMGAVVVGDLPAGVLAVGVPARMQPQLVSSAPRHQP